MRIALYIFRQHGRPKGRLCAFKLNERLHRRSAHAACAAILLVRYADDDSRNAHQKVDERLEHRDRAEDHADEVPIAAKEHAEADEAPVDAAYDEQEKRNHVKYFHNVMKIVYRPFPKYMPPRRS